MEVSTGVEDNVKVLVRLPKIEGVLFCCVGAGGGFAEGGVAG